LKLKLNLNGSRSPRQIREQASRRQALHGLLVEAAIRQEQSQADRKLEFRRREAALTAAHDVEVERRRKSAAKRARKRANAKKRKKQKEVDSRDD